MNKHKTALNKKKQQKKAVYKKITPRDSLKLAVLRQEGGISCYELVKRFGKKIPERTIYRHAKKPLVESAPVDRRHKNRRRPKN